MPELPEVETIRAQLAERIPGRAFTRVEVWDPKFCEPQTPAGFAEALHGRRVERVGRRGKYLQVALDNGDTLVIHLRMTGQLYWFEGEPDGDLRFLRARFDLDDGSTLTFGDMRRFGRAWIIPADMPETDAYWRTRLGPEPLDAGFTAKRLGQILEGRRGPLKAALLNQVLVAGIGNIYADEALFQAKLHPLRPAGSLQPPELKRLHRAIRDRLAVAVEVGGASIDRYRDSLGQRGAMQDYLRVHLHKGDPCPRCGTAILKGRVAQRGTYWCPRCQPDPVDA